MPDTTIVNTPSRQDDSATGLVLSLVIIAAVIVGGFMWYRYYNESILPASDGNTTINLSVPGPVTGGSSDASGDNATAR